MKVMGRYLVTRRSNFRGHPPGTVFEAYLDADHERRALNRGSIKLLERIPADLPPNKYRLPTVAPTAGKEVE